MICFDGPELLGNVGVLLIFKQLQMLLKRKQPTIGATMQTGGGFKGDSAS